MENARPELPMYVACRDVRRALGGCSNATVINLIADGTLPQPIKPRRNLMLFPREPLLRAFARMAASA